MIITSSKTMKEDEFWLKGRTVLGMFNMLATWLRGENIYPRSPLIQENAKDYSVEAKMPERGD